jgi:hypothetical protein
VNDEVKYPKFLSVESITIMKRVEFWIEICKFVLNFVFSFFEKMFHIVWVLVNMMRQMLNVNHFLRI